MSGFVHAQGIKTVHTGERVKKGQNSVHVVVECPLMCLKINAGIKEIRHQKLTLLQNSPLEI